MTQKEILDVRIDLGLDVTSMLSIFDKCLRQNSIGNLVSTTNAEFIMAAQRDLEFKELINNALLSLPDGVGVFYALHYLETFNSLSNIRPLFLRGLIAGCITAFSTKANQSRLSGREIIYDICSFCEKNGYNIFLLGCWEKDSRGKPRKFHGNISQNAAKILLKKFPHLNIVGATSEFSFKASDDSKTLDFIHECMQKSNVSSIDFLFVAYNHVNQEKWISRNSKKIPAKISLGVGGTFDYIAGTYKTPNSITTRYNIEWLYKLLTQPWRFTRIMQAFPLFPLKVFLRSISSKQH